ncbi:MAG: lipopolysaccharide biosynthesis protein [Fuerstiella sp.]
MTECSDNPTPLQRVMRHSRWLLVAQLVTSTASIIQAMILTRALGATSYGLYVLMFAFVTFINNALNSRVWQAISKFVPQYRARQEHDKATVVVQRCIFLEAATGLLAWIVIVALAPWAGQLIPGADFYLICLCGLVPLINLLAEPFRALVRLAERFTWLPMQAALVATLQTAGLLIVWQAGASIERMVLVMLAGAFVGVLLLAVLAARAARQLNVAIFRLPPRRLPKHESRQLWKFLLFSNLTATSAVLNSVDSLLLALFVSPASVGAYDLARKTVAVVDRLGVPVQRAVFQEISTLISERRFTELADLQRRITRRATLLVVPACLIMTALTPTLFPLVFGPEFVSAAAVLQIIVWQWLRIPLAWFRGYMLCIGRVGTMTGVRWILVILRLVLMLLLIPPLGIIGAAVAGLLCTLFWTTAAALLLRQFGTHSLTLKYVNRQSSTPGPVRSAA